MPASDGLPRSLSVGAEQSSVAEGSGVDPLATFGSVLQRRLNDTGQDRYEVIKLARRGYSTAQERYVLEHEAFAYRPDLIVWSYVLNDPVDTRYRHGVNQMSELYRPRFYLWHLVETALYNYRQRRARERCGDVEWRLFLHCQHRHDIEGEFARIVELTRARRAARSLAPRAGPSSIWALGHALAADAIAHEVTKLSH